MTPEEVNSLRDAAILLENDHIDLAFRLMEMAHRERPDGPFINNRLKQYHVRKQEDLKRVQELVQSGDLAIVASGFRCYTKSSLANALNLKQASLPFDNGLFFSAFVHCSPFRNASGGAEVPRSGSPDACNMHEA